jgi:hypothetical protein
MRIGFLYNHEQTHQIPHSLPIALALAKLNPFADIVLAVTNDRIASEIERLLGGTLPIGITILRLSIRSATRQWAINFLSTTLPAQKLLIYGDNLDFFRSLDILVVTERTSLVLKTKYGLKRPFMVLADHGAGDRAIGFGQSTALFDHVLAAGEKTRDRLHKEAGVPLSRITVTGYVKFDMKPARAANIPLQANGRPIVLYNPHLSPHLSSWYKWGRPVLDWFSNQDRYNLIFAPHIMLFERKVVFTIDKLRFGLPGKLAQHYAAQPHIHIDLGSSASTDMTYTNAADVYLGDVSSQIYEFLATPRPCAFLNPFGYAHEDDPNFAHWNAGPVINKVSDLSAILERAVSGHEPFYRLRQIELVKRTFALASPSASENAARVLMSFLERGTSKTSQRLYA